MLVEPSILCFKISDRPYYVSRPQVVSDGPYYVSSYRPQVVSDGPYYVSRPQVVSHGPYYVSIPQVVGDGPYISVCKWMFVMSKLTVMDVIV